jgi:hypothetical protein
MNRVHLVRHPHWGRPFESHSPGIGYTTFKG